MLVNLGGERAGRVSAMLLDPFSGTLHIGGSAKPVDGAFYQAALARVLPNGALDRSFGPLGRLGLGGISYLDDPRGAEIRALATRRDGTLTAAGNQFTPAPQPFLARFLDRTGCSPLVCRYARTAPPRLGSRRRGPAIRSRNETGPRRDLRA